MMLTSERMLVKEKEPLTLNFEYVMSREEIAIEVAQLEADKAALQERNEILEAERDALNGQVVVTAIRARHFASDEHDVGMKHQASRWVSIAEAHEETLALFQGGDDAQSDNQEK